MNPCLIAIAGPSGSGKSTLAQGLVERLGAADTALIVLDSYYRDLSGMAPTERAVQNFDHPDALEWPLIREQLAALRRGETVAVPCYDFATHTRTEQTELVAAQPYVVVEGLFALHDAAVRKLCTKKIFVNNSHDVCLARRTARDVAERGRTEVSVREQYAETVRPMADQYIFPTSAWADLTVDGNSAPDAMLETVLKYIRG